MEPDDLIKCDDCGCDTEALDILYYEHRNLCKYECFLIAQAEESLNGESSNT